MSMPQSTASALSRASFVSSGPPPAAGAVTVLDTHSDWGQASFSMKLQLTVESGATAGREYCLEAGQLEVGRGEGCDVRFETATGVSRRHATIRLDRDGFRLADHSANGTFIDGHRVESVL